jgi:ankyrin repeat protein
MKKPPAPGELLKAVKDDNIGKTRTLLEQGADPNVRDPVNNKTPLMYAASRGLMLTELLINHKAEIDAQDNNGMTALMYAAHDNPTILYFMLGKGASAAIKDNWGNTVVDWASKGNNIWAIDKLQQAIEKQQQLAAKKAADAAQERVAEMHDTAATRQDILKKLNRRPQMKL